LSLNLHPGGALRSGSARSHEAALGSPAHLAQVVGAGIRLRGGSRL